MAASESPSLMCRRMAAPGCCERSSGALADSSGPVSLGLRDMHGNLGWKGAAALWLATAAAASAQDAPPNYPPSLRREPLLLWLQRQTDIAPERVLAVTPQALTATISVFPAEGGPGPRVVIRAEALNSESYERAEALSWHMSVNTDCAARRVKLGATTGYAARNLLGEPRVLRPAETEWRTPGPGTALESVWRAGCDPAFKGPFQSASLKVAQADAPAAAAPEPSRVEPPAAAPPPAVPATPPVSPPARPSAPPSGAAVAQVGALPSEAEAKALLARLAGQIGEREHWVETATVGGRVWRRAIVGGFADAAEAARFCADIKAGGGDCFVRPGRPG